LYIQFKIGILINMLLLLVSSYYCFLFVCFFFIILKIVLVRQRQKRFSYKVWMFFFIYFVNFSWWYLHTKNGPEDHSKWSHGGHHGWADSGGLVEGRVGRQFLSKEWFFFFHFSSMCASTKFSFSQHLMCNCRCMYVVYYFV